MFSPNSIKFTCALSVLLFSSCGWRAAKPAETPATSPYGAEQLKSDVPFSTAEPENFQADFVIEASGERASVIFTARAGNRRRYDYDSGEKNQFTVLEIETSASFLIFPFKKIYAENLNSSANGAPQMSEKFDDFLISEWLAQKPDAKFTRLGAENNLTKYAVRLNDSDASETIVFVDEAINLPVRQEFYGVTGERKILNYAVEMKNFKRETDENLFEIPKDYKKVSLEQVKTAMRKENLGGL